MALWVLVQPAHGSGTRHPYLPASECRLVYGGKAAQLDIAAWQHIV